MTTLRRALVAGVASVAMGTPAAAQIDQSISVTVGYFALRGEDARIADDVLVENLNVFAFDLREFNNAAIGGEWILGLGEYLEAAAGLGYYRRTVPSVYRSVVNVDGSEIAQQLRLRIMPVTITGRFFPFGRSRAVTPYAGAGLGLLKWRYSEFGDFVDFSDFTVFRDQLVAEGFARGPVFLGGLRVPIGDRFSAGGELRYQRAEGELDPTKGFFDDRVDLSGVTTQFAFRIRF